MNQIAQQDADILDAVEAYRAASDAAREAKREYDAHCRASTETTTTLNEKRVAANKRASDTHNELIVLTGGLSGSDWQALY